jgi:hypothetical protein
MERDIAKVATLLVFGAILVNIGTHGQVFTAIIDSLRKIWIGSLSVVSGGTANVQ